MIIVAGTLQIEKADAKLSKPHILEVMRKTAKEKGCIVYRFSKDLQTDGLFQIYEEWETEADLDAHSKSSHIAAFLDALSKINIISRDLKKFEAANIRPL
tara:strand:- start:1357 stop:1656 length:300 start_codon:yes stop_codon:yes gene_type:complete